MRTLAAYRHAPSPVDDPGAIRLASNESAFGPLPSVVAALAHATTALHRYPDPACTDLRTAIGSRLDVAPELVHVGPGSAAVLTQLALATVAPGQRIITPWPSFELYPILAQLAEAEHVAVPLRRHTADLAAVADRVEGATRLVVLANPNNPTGTVVPGQAVVELLECLPADCLLVVDEAYADFSIDAPETGLPRLVVDRPNLVVTRTFSKLHGLASLRIGYCVAGVPVIELLGRLPPPFAVSGMAQAAALASLAAESELDARRRETVAERTRLVAALRERGWAVPEPAGNFVWIAAGADADGLAGHLEDERILTRLFDGDGVRITVGTADETDRVIAAIPDAPRRIE